MKFADILNKLIERKDLDSEEANSLMSEILEGNLTSVQISAVLTAFRMKGETVEEILGLISVMKEHMLTIHTQGTVIDTSGTGGDGSGTFNISTAAALVAASCGVQVAKHGNRASSSNCGSADVLEEMGVKINFRPKEAEEMLKKTNFTFLFAPIFHPVMKNMATVRRELGIRTIFNFLGPFVNPAKVKRQIIGVPNINSAEKLANVAKQLDYEHLMIVTSLDGLDEISISDKTLVFEIQHKSIKKYFINPVDYGLKGEREEIRGGNCQENARIIREIVNGQKGAKRDVVLLNSAAALYVAGRVSSISDGIVLASEAISSGKVKRLLHKIT